jgi:hypothetical protein
MVVNPQAGTTLRVRNKAESNKQAQFLLEAISAPKIAKTVATRHRNQSKSTRQRIQPMIKSAKKTKKTGVLPIENQWTKV